MCGSNIVGDKEKSLIAARNAKFREASKSPFGEDDEIGMLNLMSAESMRRIMSEIDGGKVFDLATDYFMGMPAFTMFGDPPYQIWMSHTPQGTINEDPAHIGREANELISYSADCFSMYIHCGTHIDALNHIGYHGKVWNQFSAHDHLGSRHWQVCGADKHPPLVARGVLLDVAGLHGTSVLPASYGIGAKDLSDALRKQKTEIQTGDVVVVRTGRMTLWPDANAYVPDMPGLNREGAEFLAKAGAIMIGADTMSVEQFPGTDPENWVVVHSYLLGEAGVMMLENAVLEELAAEKQYEFAFVAAGLKLGGATGSPVRPMAFPLRHQ